MIRNINLKDAHAEFLIAPVRPRRLDKNLQTNTIWLTIDILNYNYFSFWKSHFRLLKRQILKKQLFNATKKNYKYA